jgi:hypothetical protein
VYYEGGCNIVDNGIVYGSVTFLRCLEAGDFSDRELELSDLLNHRLCRRFPLEFPNGISEKNFSSPLRSPDVPLSFDGTGMRNSGFAPLRAVKP